MFWLTVFLLISAISAFDEPEVVRIKDRYVRGRFRKSRNNRTYLSFTGIPYAKPPVGNLRFSNPIPPEPWHDVLNATKYSPRCIQRNQFFTKNPKYEGEEDCLYLNVYTPQTANDTKLPVIFSIHWGGFAAGSGDAGYFHPLYYMDFDVVLVTFNYRLGIFGLLSTLDDEAPGNYLFKDQVLALKWVQENIEYFGGSKDKVTIIGDSAGAASVQFQIISPASEGLFSRAISQSGTAIAIWATSTNEAQLAITKTQAGLVNCSQYIGNNSELLNCFRKVPALDLLQSQDHFKVFPPFPYSVWDAVSEKQTLRNPNPFLLKSQLEHMKTGDFKKVPWLVGTTKQEGLVLILPMLVPEDRRTALNESFNSLIPKLAHISGPNTNSWFQNISEYYLDGKNYIDIDDNQWLNGFLNIFTDRFFNQPLQNALLLSLRNGHESIFLYNFEYLGEKSFATPFSTIGDKYNYKWGVSHCDDLLYQFYSPELFTPISNPNDIKLSNTVLPLWINFANYGNPNPPQNTILKNINWEPLKSSDEENLVFLNITGDYRTGPKFEVNQGFHVERLKMWENDDNIDNNKLSDTVSDN